MKIARTLRSYPLLGAVTLTTMVLAPAGAHAETNECTVISSLPTVITVQGIYCLKASLSTAITTGSAIEIATNSVVLDLNGFRIRGLAAGPATHAYGIFAQSRQNITIKNGSVRGFFNGVALENSSGTSEGHVVEDVRADQNTWAGIIVNGRGIVIRNNLVMQTGGSTYVGSTGNAYGISVDGTENRVINNEVLDTVATGQGVADAIEVFGTHELVVNNRTTIAGVGVFFGAGTTGKYRDNLTSGCSTPFIVPAAGVTDAGNNN